MDYCLKSTFALLFQGSEGWFIGEIAESGDEVCGKNGLACSEDQFHQHASDVETSQGMMKLIKSLRGSTSASSCKPASNAAVPIFWGNECLYSDPRRPKESFKCNAVGGGAKQYGKQRVCYCHDPASAPSS